MLEDDENISFIQKEMIKQIGNFEVIIFNDINCFKLECFLEKEGENLKCILTDYNLPNISGLQVVKLAIKFGIKVIVISGDASEIRKKEVLNAGADAYLTKPLMIATLERHIL